MKRVRVRGEGGASVAGSRSRAFVVCLFTAFVALRVSASVPLNGAAARIATDPAGALGRATDGWTVAGTMGEPSAQGLRELPMVLFHWLGDLLGLTPAVAQSAWAVSVLVLAVLGAARLARAVSERRSVGPDTDEGVGTGGGPWLPWVAAVVYACGPLLVATTTRAPLDGLVCAVLPWALVPLVQQRPGWRPAASSAAWLGLAGVGSPHWAVAAVVAGALAALPRSRLDLPQLLRWVLLTALACSWWLVAAAWELANSTDLTGLVGRQRVQDSLGEVLARPGWGTSWLFVVVLGPLLVAGCCVALRSRGADLRLVGGLLVASVVAVGAQTLVGWDPLVLAPAVIDRAPASLGPVLLWISLAGLLAWTPLFAQLGERLAPLGRDTLTADNLAALVAGAAVVVTSVTGLVLAAQEAGPVDTSRDDLWKQVRAWSDAAPAGRVLVLPATEDRLDPAVAATFADRPWIARDSLPASGGPATAALDDVVRRLSYGEGGPATAGALERLGISYVLVEGGRAESDRTRPAAFVRAALRAQGAVREVVATGGPAAGADQPSGLVDFGVRSSAPSLEVWSVGEPSAGWSADAAPLTVVGDTGTASDLLAAGVLGARPVRVVEATEGGDGNVVSDSARRRDVDQRRALDPYGPLLRADQRRQVVPSDAAPPSVAVRRVAGVSAVRASSSVADLDEPSRRVGSDALAAVDGNIFTAWHSRSGSGAGQWWEVVFDSPVSLTGGTVQVVQNVFTGDVVTRVGVETDAGATEVDVPADGLLTLNVPGTTKSLRIEAVAFGGALGPTDSFGISEVTVPSVTVRDELVVDGGPGSAWVLATRPSSYLNCVPVAPSAATAAAEAASATVCDRSLTLEGADVGALDRTIVTPQAAAVTGRAWVMAADTGASADLADRLASPTIAATGSSVASQDLVTRPQAAVDGDPATAWRPGPEDAQPTLTLSWRKPAVVSALRLTSGAPADVASVPLQVRVTARVAGASSPTAEVSIDVAVEEDGLVSFDPVKTKEVTVTFLADSDLVSVDSTTGSLRQVPIAIGEVMLVGGPESGYDADRVGRLPCGSGPAVTIGATSVKTSLLASARDLVDAEIVPVRLCGRPFLNQGENLVRLDASFSWIPLGLLLSAPDGALGDVGRALPAAPAHLLPAGLLDLSAGQVTLDVGDTAPATVVLAVPAGRGWTARADDKPLSGVTIDGWAQGWLVPRAALVTLTYTAGEALRLGTGLAAIGWLAVVLLALLRPQATRRRGLRRTNSAG